MSIPFAAPWDPREPPPLDKKAMELPRLHSVGIGAARKEEESNNKEQTNPVSNTTTMSSSPPLMAASPLLLLLSMLLFALPGGHAFGFGGGCGCPCMPQPCLPQPPPIALPSLCLPQIQLPCPPPPCGCCGRKKRGATAIVTKTGSKSSLAKDNERHCNNPQMRNIIIKNLLVGNPIETKSAIHSELRAKLGGEYIVLCGQSPSLSFAADSVTNYCIEGHQAMSCAAFQI